MMNRPAISAVFHYIYVIAKRACLLYVLLAISAVLGSGYLKAHGDLAVDLAQDHVDITTGFDGADLVLYGTKKQGDGNVVVVVKGPEKDMVVRKKNRMAFVWMNTESVHFEDIPSYYNIAFDVEDAGRRDEISKINKLDLKHLPLRAKMDIAESKGEQQKLKQKKRLFQEALVRNKQKERLFYIEPENIQYIESWFFKSSLHIPANVPVGDYKILTHVVNKKGKIISTNITDLRVGQVGFSAAVYDFSKQNGLAYGLICILIAVSSGFLINLVRQKV